MEGLFILYLLWAIFGDHSKGPKPSPAAPSPARSDAPNSFVPLGPAGQPTARAPEAPCWICGGAKDGHGH